MEQQFLDKKDGRNKTLAQIELERAKEKPVEETVEAPVAEEKPVEDRNGVEVPTLGKDVNHHAEPENEPKELTLDELKAMCKEKGIKFHHACKEAKLKTLLNL